MSFPACRHRRKSAPPAGVLTWLAAEPFRVFFFSGAVWSIIGVTLWPLYYAQKIAFYPSIAHARIMIECFGGAFVAGFLGTAGPRMASAPKLCPAELIPLFLIHTACGISHLMLKPALGDAFFMALLALLLAALLMRVLRYARSAPPPQMLLALTGLLCALAGTWIVRDLQNLADPVRWRLGGLLLYQGLLLPPVLGIGSFLFPRMLGGDFGEPAEPRSRRNALLRAAAAAGLIVWSFFLEAGGRMVPGTLLRAAVALVYLLVEVRWTRRPGELRGTLTKGLYWALFTGLAGISLAGFAGPLHVSVEHLLYLGGFGLLMLVVASRVLFGHSGDLAGFSARSVTARWIIGLTFVAATTRTSAEIWPKIMLSHHIYAALLWAIVCLIWLLWHRRRFLTRDTE